MTVFVIEIYPEPKWEITGEWKVRMQCGCQGGKSRGITAPVGGKGQIKFLS